MEAIKSFFGIVMLVAAIYFLGNMTALASLHHATHDLRFLLGALLLVAIGLGMGAVHLSFHAGWSTRVRKALGVALSVVGATATINWMMTPERALAWRTDEAQAFAEAKAESKHVLIDFGARWCQPCTKIETLMGSDALYDLIEERFVPFRVDLNEISDAERAIQARWNAHTLPAVVFVNASGEEIGRYDDKSPSLESLRAALRAIAPADPR
jgi:thiol:disulfide interchange protein DsbD